MAMSLTQIRCCNRDSIVLVSGGVGKLAAVAKRDYVGRLAQGPFSHAFCHLDIHRIGGNLVIDEKAAMVSWLPVWRRAATIIAPGTSDGHGLGHVDVQSRLGRGVCVLGKEVRRRFQGDRFYAAGNSFL